MKESTNCNPRIHKHLWRWDEDFDEHFCLDCSIIRTLKFEFSLDELMEELFCPHCKELNSIRNPTGTCPHYFNIGVKWQTIPVTIIDDVGKFPQLVDKKEMKQKVLEWISKNTMRSVMGYEMFFDGHTVIYATELQKFLEEL